MDGPGEQAGARRRAGARERERAYSPSSCIGGDYGPYIDAYSRLSEEAREATNAAGARWLEGRYGAQPAERMDLVLPPASGRPDRRCPLLVYIHGGYWQELSAAQSLFAARGCIAHGVAFAALDYTLAPAAGVGAIVAQCRRALARLRAEAEALGIAPDRIVVAGSSAGAHLAAMVALEPGAGCAGAVLVSGIYDLEPLVGTSINAALRLTHRSAARASPSRGPLDHFPPALLAWGRVETAAFKQQSRAFARQLASAGQVARCLEVPGRNHFDVILDLAEPDTDLGRRTLALLLA